jgi:hypothetical protein
MTDMSVHEALRRLFGVIAAEADRNEAFARKLLEALQADGAATTEKPRPSARRPFDASALHAINLLRVHGENVLRGKLEQVKAAENLRAVARHSGLVLAGEAAKPRASRGQLIEGIVAAAKHYDAQRTEASA